MRQTEKLGCHSGKATLHRKSALYGCLAPRICSLIASPGMGGALANGKCLLVEQSRFALFGVGAVRLFGVGQIEMLTGGARGAAALARSREKAVLQ